MRMKPLVVLRLVVVGLTCFTYTNARNEVDVPMTSMEATKSNEMFQPTASFDPQVKNQVQTTRADATTIVQERDELTALAKNTQWTQATRNEVERLKTTLENTKLKQFAEEPAAILAKRPSTWHALWSFLPIMVGGTIAGLVLAALYGMWQ